MHGSLILWQLALVGTHASLPYKVYWHSVLPNTPMPKAVQDSLGSDGQIQIQTPFPIYISFNFPNWLIGEEENLGH